jgi:hypothetical protein
LIQNLLGGPRKKSGARLFRGTVCFPKKTNRPLRSRPYNPCRSALKLIMDVAVSNIWQKDYLWKLE